MSLRVRHDLAAETPEAKARWFQSLPLSARMELLCAYTDLILQANPGILEKKRRAQSSQGRVRILRKA